MTILSTLGEVKKLWNNLNQLTDKPKETVAHQALRYILNTSNTEELGNILDNYSGQLYASGLALSFQKSAMINRVLGRRLDQLTQTSENFGMWFDLYKG